MSVTVAVPLMRLDAVIDAPATVPLTLTPVSPEDNGYVPVARPRFTLTVRRNTNTVTTATIEVDILNYADLSVLQSLSATVNLAATLTTVSVPATADLADTTDGHYRWRARYVLAGVPGAWIHLPYPYSSTDTGVFYADTTGTYSMARVVLSWTVDSGVDAQPHLWFAMPPAAAPGESITIYGGGLGDAAGTVHLAGLAATVTSCMTKAATANAATADRTINTTTGQVDPEHQEITIIVPAADPPGGVLVARTG